MTELLALGVSHKTAPLELRERVALTEGRATGVLNELVEAAEVQEAAAISTCNRTELYLAAPDPVGAESRALGVLAREAGTPPTELVGHLYSLRGADAVLHLFQVTAGLDSMILGAGKRARSETGITERGVSVPSVAVELAQRALGDLSSRLVLVVGAGETAELTARALAARGVEPAFIANRRYDRAIGLAQRFGGRAVRFEELPDQMEKADIVVASTSSPHHVIEREALAEVMRARDGRPLILIDLAVPRDIHPGCRDLEGVVLYDMDDLQALVERNASGREAEARRADSILRAELTLFERWLGSQDVVPTVAALRARADDIVSRVLAENEPRWDSLSENDRERIRAMARAIASRLLHEPTLRLKRSSGDENAYVYVNALRDLFGLDAETEPVTETDAEVRPLRTAKRRKRPAS